MPDYSGSSACLLISRSMGVVNNVTTFFVVLLMICILERHNGETKVRKNTWAASPAAVCSRSASRSGARHPVDVEEVAVGGLHRVLLQRVALRLHQRCRRRQGK